MDILSKIIKYESRIFEEYSNKRQLLIEHLQNVNIKSLNNTQLKIFIHDIKAIIEPIKTSACEIDYYFTNTDFKKTENIEHFQRINTLHLLNLCLPCDDLVEADDTETSDSSS